MTDLHESLDELQSDMAAHQARFRGEVTASSNQALAVGAIERIDREQREAPPLLPPSAYAAPAPIESKLEHREGKHGAYLVSTEAEQPKTLRVASDKEHWFFVHAMPRIELLLTKVETGALGQPSWNQRTMSVLGIMQESIAFRQAGFYEQAAALHVEYEAQLEMLLDSSSIFGDWRADAPTKLTVSG